MVNVSVAKPSSILLYSQEDDSTLMSLTHGAEVSNVIIFLIMYCCCLLMLD